MDRLLRPSSFLFAWTAVAAVVVGDQALRRAVPATPSQGELISGTTYDGRRAETKHQIGEDAAAGRLSLLEAASAMKELDAVGSPYPLEVLTNCDPGVSLDEGYCRMVIRWLPSAVSSDQADCPARRLEKELNERLRDGSLRLPEKGDGL
jgi:hypothetical protein